MPWEVHKKCYEGSGEVEVHCSWGIGEVVFWARLFGVAYICFWIMWFPKKKKKNTTKVGAEGVVAEEGCESGTRLDGFACSVINLSAFRTQPLISLHYFLQAEPDRLRCYLYRHLFLAYDGVCVCLRSHLHPSDLEKFFLQSQALKEDTSTEAHTLVPLKTSPCYPHTCIIYMHLRLAHTQAHTEFCTQWPEQDFRQL